MLSPIQFGVSDEHQLAATSLGLSFARRCYAIIRGQKDRLARHTQLDILLVSWLVGCMKTTFDLPDELVREVKLRAVVQGRTVKELVAELLSESLGLALHPSSQGPSRSRMVEVGGHGLPVVRCDPRAPATRMKAKALLKLEQETQLQEDLRRAGITN
jgi:hypothetical protein